MSSIRASAWSIFVPEAGLTLSTPGRLRTQSWSKTAAIGSMTRNSSPMLSTWRASRTPAFMAEA